MKVSGYFSNSWSVVLPKEDFHGSVEYYFYRKCADFEKVQQTAH